MKNIKTFEAFIDIHGNLTEFSLYDKYDIVKTINTESNGYRGIGIVSHTTEDSVYVLPINSANSCMIYGSEFRTKNPVRLSKDNVKKYEEGDNISIEDERAIDRFKRVLADYIKGILPHKKSS